VLVVPRNSRDIIGVFAQGNYQVTSALEAQLGLRYSHFDASGTGGVFLGQGFPGFPPNGIQLADLSGSHTDARVTGKAALNWTVGDGHLIYAFAARGYKPGGCESPALEFGPETVWNYEVGWKGSLVDDRVRLQFAAFYNDFNDLQFDVLEPSTGITGVDNIGSATVRGFEGQIQARFGGLGIDGGFGYLDTELSSLTYVNTRDLPPGQLGPQCPAGVPANPPTCFDYGPYVVTAGGGPNLYSPEWTYNIGVQYSAELSDRITVTPRLNYGYVGSRYTDLLYTSLDLLQSRGLLSALVTLEVDDWKVEGYATNLADKEYVAGRSGNNEFYGAPREYGLRVGMVF
jgi:iron complex outermembrane receptor protein